MVQFIQSEYLNVSVGWPCIQCDNIDRRVALTPVLQCSTATQMAVVCCLWHAAIYRASI
ncbi:hypothetical protein PLICRDRAFT_38863 [Plicaturopsis crispa FD-325 SS-3]|nr:hypothetical protein PLICRDRAFT_38863 [Plicaturopsis crispa FD-325 SS-3]